MKKLILLLAIAATCAVAGYSQSYHYDVNGDGVVTAHDITALYDYMLGNVSSLVRRLQYVLFLLHVMLCGHQQMGAATWSKRASCAHLSEIAHLPQKKRETLKLSRHFCSEAWRQEQAA